MKPSKAWKNHRVFVPFGVAILTAFLFWTGFNMLEQCDLPEYEQNDDFKKANVDCDGDIQWITWVYLGLAILNALLSQRSYSKLLKQPDEESKKEWGKRGKKYE